MIKRVQRAIGPFSFLINCFFIARRIILKAEEKFFQNHKKEYGMKKAFLALSLLAGIAAYPGMAFADEEVKDPFFLDYQRSLEKPFEMGGFKTFKADWCYTQYDNRFPGFFSCLNTRHKYAEAYVGPTFEFGEIQAGAGLGFEAGASEKMSQRLAGFLRYRFKRVSVYVLAETGGSGPRYKAEADVGVAKLLTLGAVYEKSDGVGPRVKIAIPTAYTQVWYAPLYNPETKEVSNVIGAHIILY